MIFKVKHKPAHCHPNIRKYSNVEKTRVEINPRGHPKNLQTTTKRPIPGASMELA